MVVEHTFVTTLEPAEAFRVATEFLESRGFRVTDGPRTHEAEGGRCEVVGFKRGKQGREARSGNLADLPQSVWIEHDRGRVVVGASIIAYPPSLFLHSSKEIAPDSAQAKPFRDLLFMIALSLEALLCPSQEKPALPGHWDAMEANYANHRKAHRRGEYRKLAIVAAVIVAFLAVVIAAVSSGSGPRPARATPPAGYRSGR